MKKLISIFLLACAFVGTQSIEGSTNNILPRPQSVVDQKGYLSLDNQAPTFFIDSPNSELLASQLESYGWKASPKSKALIKININGKGTAESYKLTILPKKIELTATDQAGAFYGIQSLRQLLDQAAESGKLQCATITDSPRFPWRGVHFDVSRHFRSIDFLKKQIDAMAAMKLNRMHLHLTDAAGWRMQSDSFPRLASYAAWRPERSWSDWSKNGARYCDESTPGAYGGYYTKEQLKDLINYAAERHIIIIPEIEMPGHSEEVVAAYPHLGCDGAEHTGDLCPGKETTFDFLQTILDETIDIFPSEYIHIGGDEASKGAWHNCPACKKRMQDEGLENVDQLQSYLIKRIETYVNSKGRKMIGWDEILQGGLAPNATVMSWRGVEGGLKAIAEGHDVVMTPGEFCYIDYCQDAPFTQPNSIGGYTPLSKVYEYEPIDSSLTADQAHHVLGLQANLWTEYVTDDDHCEYMYYPRVYAVAETGWSPAEKDYADFHRRALVLNDKMIARGYHPFDLANEYGARRESLDTISHNAIGAKVDYITSPSKKYSGNGPTTLVDGLQGNWTNVGPRWQGWNGDVEVVVDLGEPKEVNYAGASFMHSEGAWIHLPDYVEFSTSLDGQNFTPAKKIYVDVDPKYEKILFKNYSTVFPHVNARYVKLKAKANKREGSWLFTDEIIVN